MDDKQKKELNYQMQKELSNLINLHDEIKESHLRMAGLDGVSLPLNSKDIYYSKLKYFVWASSEYYDIYSKSTHEILKDSNCESFHYFSDDLESSYSKTNNLLDFIAETDFLVLSKIHEILEKTYKKLSGQYRSPYFHKRYEK